MLKYIFALFVFTGLVGGLFLYTQASAQAKTNNQNGVHVLELFTSQSCSSCPSADAFLEELDRRDDVITLSCNVTYWNHLHWEDTLSQNFCTQKQRGYSYSQNRAGRIFTPELMINGQKSIVGSKRCDINAYLANGAKTVASLNLNKTDGDIVVRPLNRAFNMSANNTVTLIIYEKKHTQFIPSGENRGRTIHYSNPILKMKTVEENWDGSKPLTVSVDSTENSAGYVVLISDQSATGKILAAGKVARHG